MRIARAYVESRKRALGTSTPAMIASGSVAARRGRTAEAGDPCVLRNAPDGRAQIVRVLEDLAKIGSLAVSFTEDGDRSVSEILRSWQLAVNTDTITVHPSSLAAEEESFTYSVRFKVAPVVFIRCTLSYDSATGKFSASKEGAQD